MSKIKEAKEKDKRTLDQILTEQFLQANKDLHYNFEEFRGNYKISTGSKIFDEIVDGGFGSGLIRFVGGTESGKTAEALTIHRNFLEKVPNSKGIFIKAEGRLSDKMKARSGVKFVYKPEQWEVGTSFIFECNVYEVVFDWLRALILDPKNKVRYHIIIDSMDGLIPKDALKKTTGEAAKVAAGAVMTSDFLKRTNIGLAKRGHQCIMMSQIRAEIRADKYTPKDKNKIGGASGGNAAVHMPDWIIEFLRPKKDDFIVLEDKELTTTNRPLGRYANVRVCKSTNDTTGILVSYPVKFERKTGSRIWGEREIIELLLGWGYIEKTSKGSSWFQFDEELAKYAGQIKVQGMDNLYQKVETDAELKNKLSEFTDVHILNEVY